MTMNGDELDLRRETISGGGVEVTLAWSMPLVPRWSRDGLETVQDITMRISGADESLGW